VELSNLLNNKAKKKLLDRGPKITPTQEFKLTDTEETNVQPELFETELLKTANVQKKKTKQSITSVRVTKATRNKLNALVQLGRAESVDILIDILIDEYVDTNLAKEEKKTYEIILQVLHNKERS